MRKTAVISDSGRAITMAIAVTQIVPITKGRNPKLFLKGCHDDALTNSHSECSASIGIDLI